jgi:nitroreductase
MIRQLLESRRSVRRFKREAVPREALERILEAAILAPSASNKQPWRFVVVEQRERIHQMAAAVREALERIAERLPEDSVPAFRAYGDYFTRFEDAPVVIVPLFRGFAVLSHLVDGFLEASGKEALIAMERDSALVGTSLAVGNLLLMAHATGLGASVMTGPLIASPALRGLLDVPSSWGIVALVAVGVADEVPPPTERKPLGRVVRWL